MNDDYVVTYSVNNGHHHHHCVMTPIQNRKHKGLERQVWDLLRQAEMSRQAYERVALSMKELNVSLSLSA